MDLYRGAPEGVLARLKENGPALRHSLFERVQSIRVSLESLRARAHLALGARISEGKQVHLAAAEKCAKRLSKQGLAGSAAHAHLVRAGVASVAGDASAAASHLRAAMAGYDAR